MKDPGIYIIRNTQTRHVYIGSSVNVSARIANHLRLLRRGKHSNRILQAAWSAYGEQVFVIDKIETPHVTTDRELRLIEQHYLNRYQSFRPDYGYNQASSAVGCFYQRVTSWRRKHAL